MRRGFILADWKENYRVASPKRKASHEYAAVNPEPAANEKGLASALLRKAGDGRRFRGIDLKHGDQLGHLQNFLKFRAEMTQL